MALNRTALDHATVGRRNHNRCRDGKRLNVVTSKADAAIGVVVIKGSRRNGCRPIAANHHIDCLDIKSVVNWELRLGRIKSALNNIGNRIRRTGAGNDWVDAFEKIDSYGIARLTGDCDLRLAASILTVAVTVRGKYAASSVNSHHRRALFTSLNCFAYGTSLSCVTAKESRRGRPVGKENGKR